MLRHSQLVDFDPDNHKHLKVYADFIKNKSWGKACPFYLVDPWLNVPSMIDSMLARHHLQKTAKFPLKKRVDK
jgi:hypothetical protein